MSLHGAALPTLPIPLIVSADPTRLARFYVHALEFDLVQHIVGVFALLRSGKLLLQIWGRGDAPPTRTCVTLEEGDASIFDLHRQLARVAPALLDSPTPHRTEWGGWQFRLTDIDANQLFFMQPAPCGPAARGPHSGAPTQRFRPRR